MACPGWWSALTSPPTRRGGRGGKRSARPLLLVGGDVVAMCGDNIAQNRTGWPPFLSLWLLVRRWRDSERLAMVWTVEEADGTEERRGTGKDGGGILRPGSLSFCFVCSFALPYPHHLKDWTMTRTRRSGWQTVEALPCCLFAAGRSVAMCGDNIAQNRTG